MLHNEKGRLELSFRRPFQPQYLNKQHDNHLYCGLNHGDNRPNQFGQQAGKQQNQDNPCAVWLDFTKLHGLFGVEKGIDKNTAVPR